MVIDAHTIEQMARKLTEALPPELKIIKDEVEKSMAAVLAAQLHKLDLVTRSEFDAQVRVLTRLREKLEALEQRLN